LSSKTIQVNYLLLMIYSFFELRRTKKKEKNKKDEGQNGPRLSSFELNETLIQQLI